MKERPPFSCRPIARRAVFLSTCVALIVPITQGVVGAAYSLWKIGFAAEYDVAPVNTLAVTIGFDAGANTR